MLVALKESNTVHDLAFRRIKNKFNLTTFGFSQIFQQLQLVFTPRNNLITQH